MRIGIDLGGTKIEIIVLDAQGNECLRRRVPTPQGDYTATLQAIVTLIHEAEREFGTASSVGIGTPGTLSRVTGRLKNSNSVVLNDQPLVEHLQDLLKREIRISNDANCFTISEATDGAGMGAAVVFGVILGTGVGGGIVVNQRVLIGINGIAGEWGHNPLPWLQADEQLTPLCYCGRYSCIEAFLAGPSLTRLHLASGGGLLAPPEIVRHAAAGDRLCEASLQRYEQRLARALAHVINLLDPDVIVLGGGMSHIERLYQHVPTLWQDWVFSDRVDTRLLKSQHGDSSGVRGAAWLE